MLTTQAVANTFIKAGAEEMIPLTPMKLQKLVYIFYKHYYQKTKKKLFTESFEKWKYGPVLPSLYYEFKSFGASPVTKFSRNAQGMVEVMQLNSNPTAKKIFKEVWDKYKHFSAVELSRLTHQANTAWSKAKTVLKDEDIMNEPEYQ